MVSHATIVGRHHRLMQQNCQDFALAAAPAPGMAFGLVCDGCGSKFQGNGRFIPSRNEVGATLLGQFAADFLSHRLPGLAQCAGPPTVEQLLSDLYLHCLTLLGHLAAQFPKESREQLISTQLLATILGFIRTPETVAFFWQGDGFLAMNGRICRLECRNRPDYLAYQLLQPDASQNNFRLAFVPAPNTIDWLAVASDGWSESQLGQLAQPRTALALQRRLNVAARWRGLFDDDGSVAAWHKQGIPGD